MENEITDEMIKSANLLKRARGDHSKKLEEYKKQKLKDLANGKRAELEVELNNMKEYLKGCRESRIPDTLDNITFKNQKVTVLEEILNKKD